MHVLPATLRGSPCGRSRDDVNVRMTSVAGSHVYKVPGGHEASPSNGRGLPKGLRSNGRHTAQAGRARACPAFLLPAPALLRGAEERRRHGRRHGAGLRHEPGSGPRRRLVHQDSGSAAWPTTRSTVFACAQRVSRARGGVERQRPRRVGVRHGRAAALAAGGSARAPEDPEAAGIRSTQDRVPCL